MRHTEEEPWGLGSRWDFITEPEHPVTQRECFVPGCNRVGEILRQGGSLPLLSTLAVWEGILGHDYSHQNPNNMFFRDVVISHNLPTKSVVLDKGFCRESARDLLMAIFWPLRVLRPGLFSSSLHCWMGTCGDLNRDALLYPDMALPFCPASI